VCVYICVTVKFIALEQTFARVKGNTALFDKKKLVQLESSGSGDLTRSGLASTA